MSSIATERDIEDATERLANNPAQVWACLIHDPFWKEIILECYAGSKQLRELFASFNADVIFTLAEQIAAERMVEEAEQAADDERFEQDDLEGAG